MSKPRVHFVLFHPEMAILAMTQHYSYLAPEQPKSAVRLLDGVIEEKRELVW